MRFGPRMTDDQRDKLVHARLAAMVIVLVGLTAGAIAGRFVPPALAEAVGYSTGVILFWAYMLWDGLERRWFWGFMTVVALLHVVVLRVVPWPLHHNMDTGILLAGLGDLILVGIVGTMVRQLTRRAGSSRLPG